MATAATTDQASESFGKKVALGVGVAGLGLGAVLYAPTFVPSEQGRKAIRLAGYVAIGIGGYLTIRALPGLLDELGTAAKGTRDLGGLLGVAGKTVFGQTPAGTITSDTTSTDDVDTLGKPKNIKGLVGRILKPAAGEEASRELGSDTYSVEVAVANVGDASVTTTVKLVATETPALQSDQSFTSSADGITLKPGDPMRLLTMRVGVAIGVTVPFETIPVTLRLYAAGYLLDKIEITRE